MWVALLVFCLFLLLISLLLYGLHQWENLLADPDEDAPPELATSGHPPGRFLALWVLLVGLGGIAILEELLTWIAE